MSDKHTQTKFFIVISSVRNSAMTDPKKGFKVFPDGIRAAEEKPQDDAKLESEINAEHEAELISCFIFDDGKPIDAPDYSVKNLLPVTGVAFIGGQSGAAKTFVAVDLAVALSAAQQFFGRRVKERVGVAILAAEGASTMKDRIRVAAKHRQLDSSKIPVCYMGQVPDLKSNAEINKLIERLKALSEYMLRTFKLRLGVVIIDTVAAAFDLDDEDDNSEAAKVIRKMRAISDVTDTLVVPVHHYGKSPKTGLRGASGWRAGCDAVISCIADRDEISGVVSGHELALAKSRQHQEGPVAPFELAFESLGVDPDGDEFGSLYVIPLLDRPSKIAGTITTKREPQSLTVFRAAFTDVMAVGGGQTIKVGGNGPAVFAARVSDVRAEFDRRYPTGDVDPQKVNNALASAFRRGLREATSREYANERQSDVEWIWDPSRPTIVLKPKTQNCD